MRRKCSSTCWDEIQNVYRSQGVPIDDKHIEIIISQMMRKVQVADPGDAEFLPGAVVDKFHFRRENDRLRKERKKPATGQTLLLGVTKASLSSESFISAASFQETTKVLTEAAIAGRRDHLVGLKENVILGHMVPTGTGFRDHYRTRVKKNIDFGEIGKGFGSGSSADPEIEALLSGGLGALTGSGLSADVGGLGATGTEGAPATEGDLPDPLDVAGRLGAALRAGGRRGFGRRRADHLNRTLPGSDPDRQGAGLAPAPLRRCPRAEPRAALPRLDPRWPAPRIFAPLIRANAGASEHQSHAHHQPARPQGTDQDQEALQVARAGRLPAKAWRVSAGEDADPEEAELGVAEGRACAPLQR